MTRKDIDQINELLNVSALLFTFLCDLNRKGHYSSREMIQFSHLRVSFMAALAVSQKARSRLNDLTCPSCGAKAAPAFDPIALGM